MGHKDEKPGSGEPSGSGAGSLVRELVSEMARGPDGLVDDAVDATLIGRTVGRYRIARLLGKGGMGRVYEARDEDLRRAVALKLLPASVANDEERRQRFMREARSAAAITHPNVAVIYDIGESEGRIYIAMELIVGENLRERLERGRLDLAASKEFAAQIAHGLAAAHEKGIVHRDLKPENVMITPTGVVKLLDFGLAKSGVDRGAPGAVDAAHAETVSLVTSGQGRILGTPHYMSPEQAMGAALDVRSDVFSFGIVLYEMLSGRRPFDGATTGAVLVAIARDPVPPLRELAPEVDEGTQAIVLRCLAKAPAERFASAGEVVDALSSAAAPAANVDAAGRAPARSVSHGTSESRAEVTPFTRSGTVRPRRTGRLAAVGLVLALLGVGGWRWVTRGKVASVAPLTSASSVAPTAAAGAEGLPRSSNPEAQRFFEEALRSFHDGTGQFVPLLQKSVQTDPTFGGAYLRLWAVTRGDSDPGTAVYHEAGREHADEYHQRLIALEGTLSPRDRAFLQCIDAPTVDLANAKLDEYLARYPDDDIAWQERFDEMPETADRALVADPTLVPALANKARHSPLTSPGSAAFRSA